MTKKLLTIILLMLLNVPAGLLLIAFFAVLEIIGSYHRAQRRKRGIFSGATVTREREERFQNEMQELEHKVVHVGQRVL